MAPTSLKLSTLHPKALKRHRLSTVASPSCAKLPYDIWLYITSFLDCKTVRKLYSINRELFDIAMDERYREACIGYHSTDPAMFACNWQKAWGPLSAPRIKHLLFQSGAPYGEKQTERRLHQRVIKSIRFSIYESNMEHNISKAIKVAPKMTSVTALSIWLDRIRDPWHYASKREILRQGWPVFGPKLRTLVLHTPLEDIPDILNGVTFFPQLENFSINITITFRTSDPTALLCRTILPLVNNHRTTLKALSLESWKERIDLSLFLSQLSDIPNLLDIHLLQIFDGVEVMDTTGHCRFLSAHKSQLRHLGLHFMQRYAIESSWKDWIVCTPAVWDISKSPITFYKHYIWRKTPPLHTIAHDAYNLFSQYIYQIHFPNLESFDLGVPELSCPYSPKTIPYLQKHLHNLTSLSVVTCSFTYERIALLLSQPKGFSYRIRKFHLYIEFLCPELLLFLAKKLPNLVYLVLYCQDFSPHKDQQVEVAARTTEFCRVMQATAFPGWNLYSFNIRFLAMLSPAEEEKRQISKAILTALPNLEFICDESREKILDYEEKSEGKI